MNSRLARDFFARPTLTVARELLGCRLVRRLGDIQMSGLITETEAYVGEDDKACHAAVGRTVRNTVMYSEPGHLYVYLIYGMHHCLNIVTETAGYPAAALIRGLVPDTGIQHMRRHRAGRPDRELTNGPGKICAALKINLRHNGLDLVTNPNIFIELGQPVTNECVESTPRIRVSGDDRAVTAPWRFVISAKSKIFA